MNEWMNDVQYEIEVGILAYDGICDIDSNKQDWACTQYKALIPPAIMVKALSSGNGSLLDGTAFNRICKK